jgi:guanine deaminase
MNDSPIPPESGLSAADEPCLRRAIELSRQKMEAGAGGPFGAVIAREGEIIAEGWNQVTSGNDPTAHAEVAAIRAAAAKLGRFSLAGCDLFSSCEPCPMCLAAAYWARVDRVVFAASQDDAAAAGFDDAFLYRELALSQRERSLPMIQAMRGDAALVFRAWDMKPDKIPY